MGWRHVSATDENYEEKAGRFLASLAQAQLPTPPLHLTVDYDARQPVAGVEYRRIESAGFRAPSPIRCLQHGEFWPAVDEDVVLFTDCDIYVQRPFNEEELGILEGITPGHVWCSHNNYEGDSLFHEGIRLKPINRDFATLFGHPDLPFRRHPLYMPIYNTGVLAMHRETWLWVYEEYVRLWPVISTLLRHYARQQWLLSYLVTVMGLEVHIWPEAFHSHGCFNEVRPHAARFSWRQVDGEAHKLWVTTRRGDEEICLRHHWELA